MHRRAEKLADRFNLASTQRMAKGNERGAPTGPLFHYTSVAALEGIVTSETFWFTSVYHMDDDQELSFGFGISHDLLAAALAREDANVIKPSRSACIHQFTSHAKCVTAQTIVFLLSGLITQDDSVTKGVGYTA